MYSVRLLIKGKVQGVFFRSSAKKKADELQIKGWVGNREDGNVEAMVEGPDNNVLKFIGWCRTGSQESEVTDVIVSGDRPKGFDEFSVR